MIMRFKFPTEEEIRVKAYRIYLARGSEPGHAEDDWLQAEYELMQLPLEHLAKLDTGLVEKEPVRNRKLFDLTRAALKLKWQTIWSQSQDFNGALAAQLCG